METGLTQEEIHLLLRDMTDFCLRPPEEETWRFNTSLSSEVPRERVTPLGRLCRWLDASRPWSMLLLVVALFAPLVALTLQVAFMGPLPSVALIGASSLAGAWVILRQGRGAFRSISESIVGLQVGRGLRLVTLERALRVLGGLLLLVPDPLTSCLAVVLLASDVRRTLARWLQRQAAPVFGLS